MILKEMNGKKGKFLRQFWKAPSIKAEVMLHGTLFQRRLLATGNV